MAAVVAGVCGALVHRHGFVVLAAIGSTLAVGLAWPWLTVWPLTARLAFDTDRGREGRPVTLRLVVRNRSPLPAAGLTLVGLNAGPIPVGTIAPLAAVDLPLSFVPPQRGQYPSRPVRLTCSLPFGLWHPGRAIRVDRPMLAWPAEAAVELPAGLHGRRSVATTLATAAAMASAGDEFHGVRPYRRGDPVKLVHHAQTARHDRLIVRELSGVARPAVRVAVDSAEASYTDAGERERAIRTAASLCAACVAAGIDVDAVVEGRVRRVGTETLDALARVGSPGGPAARDLLAGPACRGRGRQVVVVTSAATRLTAGSALVVTVAGGIA